MCAGASPTPLRQVVSTVLYPVPWLMVQPLRVSAAGQASIPTNRTGSGQHTRKEVLQLSLRANQAQELLQENERLRKLLDLREAAASACTGGANPVRHGRPLHAARGRGPGPGTAGWNWARRCWTTLACSARSRGCTRFLSQVTLLVDRDQADSRCSISARGRAAWPMATEWPATAVVWNCVSSRPTPMCKRPMCSPPADSMGSTPLGLPRGTGGTGRAARRLRICAGPCTPTARVEGARHVMLITPTAGTDPARPAEPAAVLKRANKNETPATSRAPAAHQAAP